MRFPETFCRVPAPLNNPLTQRGTDKRAWLVSTLQRVAVGALGVTLLFVARSGRAVEDASATPPRVVTNTVPYVARPLPLGDVRLTGGPLQRAQQLDADYLLKLEPDRMLYFLRLRAGLPPKAKAGYGGWDGGKRQLTGHIVGHYLSAVSYMWAATGDGRFKERADYIVEELKAIQDKQGDGYLGALTDEKGTDGKVLFAQLGAGVIRSGGFDLNGLWSPWYVEHKIFAGLRDAYRLTGNRTALEVEIKFAAWADGILGKLDSAQIQKMLATEFGGMNEVAADLYADTGDKRWLALSDRFEHRAVLDPLDQGEDRLGGLHANTQVPKLIGSLARYVCTGNQADGAAARNFWDAVVDHHSFATGGHGKNEYFGARDQLNDGVDGRTAESCNVYNMLKLTRMLFSLQPDIKYAEFQERALFNHVLGSMDDKGSTCYMVPVGRGVTHEYQDMFGDFTCCVGTGMENHALHGDGIYYESGDNLWVNLYTPSTAAWKTTGAKLEMQTDFPEGQSVKIKLALKTPAKFTLALRRPSWAGAGFEVMVNGVRAAADLPGPGSYTELAREWRDGDIVEFTLPKTLREEPVPDNPRRVALMWGPLVLAGDLGPEDGAVEAHKDLSGVPVLVTNDRNPADWLRPVANEPGAFRTAGVGRERDVDFVPFYRLHHRLYALYWDVFTPPEWEQRAQEIAAERDRQHKLELATVAYAQPGEMQSERDFNERGEDSSPDRVMGRAARRGTRWFSFDLPVDSGHPAALVVTYYSDEWRRRTFEILADGQRVGEQTVEKGGPPRFFNAEYPLPANLVGDKIKVTVRFQATGGSEIAAVFGIRMVRADAPR